MIMLTKAVKDCGVEIDFTEGQTFEIVPLEQANGGTIILAVIILASFYIL